jgi:sodium pump decarboxylase gamma subunit
MDNPIINGIFVFVLGLAIVFLGMLIIVICVSLCGKLLSAKDKKETQVKQEEVQVVQEEVVNEVSESNEIPTHIKAAIVAAITAYYFESQQSKCDFIVKKIRRF